MAQQPPQHQGTVLPMKPMYPSLKKQSLGTRIRNFFGGLFGKRKKQRMEMAASIDANVKGVQQTLAARKEKGFDRYNEGPGAKLAGERKDVVELYARNREPNRHRKGKDDLLDTNTTVYPLPNRKKTPDQPTDTDYRKAA